MTGNVTKEQMEIHDRLMNDYDYFARHIQRIEPKDLEERDEEIAALQEAILSADPEPTPGMMPLIFQPGQMKLHRFVTDMKRRRGGIVRCVLVKPRQVGWSTYIQGRAHWLATKTPAFKVFIISHNADSTRKFLRRAQLLCKTAPPSIQAGRRVENTKELAFDNGATYAIATAGSPDAMRSDACHFLHGSEVPFWANLSDNLGAVIPALSDGPGSEGYLESTSKGKGTPWHEFVLETQRKENEWELFFDAWFNHPKYKATPPEGWTPNDYTKEAMVRWNLDLHQAYWRQMRAKALRSEWLFKQEYPGSVEESFQSSGDTLINPDAVWKAAQNRFTPDMRMPLILGVDPARTGDRTVIAPRRGKIMHKPDVYQKMEDMRLAGMIAGYLNHGYHGQYVSMVFIDYAIGEGVASFLRSWGHANRICVVNFGEGATDPRFLNKRAEMACTYRDWFGDTGEFVSLEYGTTELDDYDAVSGDILAIPDFKQGQTTDKIQLVAKEEIKKAHGGKSPDIFDAQMLTFAHPVAGERTIEVQQFFQDNFSHLSTTELTALLSDFNF